MKKYDRYKNVPGSDEDKLTEEEYKKMQQHPVFGYRILNLFDTTLDLAEAVYAHHENWDGTGYPKGIKGKEISMSARIVAVAEAYDTLINQETSDPEHIGRVLMQLKQMSGTKLDPEIVEAFIKSRDKQAENQQVEDRHA